MMEAIVNPQNILAAVIAIAVFATILTIALPMLANNELNSRMNSVAIEREKIRRRERERMAKDSQQGGSLKKAEATGIARQVVDKLNLRTALADESTMANLKMAGYRQQSHLTMYLFARIVAPLIFMAIAALYIFVILKIDKPLMVRLIMTIGIGALGFYLPTLLLKNKITKRQLSIKRAWPDALDLMLICVESGISLEQAFQKVAVEIGVQSPQLAEELVLTNAELSYLQERRQAFENLGARIGLDAVKAVSMALIQAERYGTPVSTALRILSQESRDMRMAEAEKKAAALPPKLTVPMIVFFLPVLFAVIIGPAIIKISSM